MSKKAIIFILLIILGAGFIVWSQNISSPASASLTPEPNSDLEVREFSYDFGEITKDIGLLPYIFKIRNSSQEKISFVKLYSTCTCLTATWLGKEKIGPFSMPGEEVILPLNTELAPHEEAGLLIELDPQSLAPGEITQNVRLETWDGKFSEFKVQAKIVE